MHSTAKKMAQSEAKFNGDTSPKQVFFFDIDNCLYPKSAKVHDRMADLIDQYFQKHLNLPIEEATRLHSEYYQTYGLAIEGLVRHHEIDPLEYNSKVDDALPLEGIIKPRPELKKLLEDIDTSQVRLWLFTNAYINHAKRVVRLLGVEDKFEGVTFCDYSSVPFVCKPQEASYVKAMREAGVEKWEDCFFVDDSYINCVKAQELGWTTAHLVEDGAPVPAKQASRHQIKHLEDLRTVFPHFFKKA
ncbi:pyrimidine 5'-nucleotidase [Coniella lustricola]|uniref:Pyrimidine 5'-nucleotidase n=1 Tax=Coniella lustricola TaxID=2025994 RepID=A0A2T3AKK8_9PEZI|nr:pyrimidine 5'-nucleotidase [Coniella lustricola]